MAEKQSLFILNKEIGETPLECMECFRLRTGLDPLLPTTYAGRLDPMAEGVLLVLVGEECKNKDKYLGLDKEYEVEILFGFSTDTYDLLGRVESGKRTDPLVENQIQKELEKFKGKFVQEYPAYSSKTVDGVQLHELANKGELPETMPTKEVEIYNIEMLEEREISSEILLKEVKEKISKVKGTFRQSEILDLWRKSLNDSINQYSIIKLKISCSSGTYMRSLAHNLGRNLGVQALAYSIKRVKVGNYSL
jgi:tRNA pseudouridine55 synthase